jgi:hypothetical protein
MLTGDRPFIADEAPQLLELHRTAPVPRLTERAPGVSFPRGLDAVIERAMAKDADERWSSAVAFSDALDNVARLNALPIPRLASQPVYQVVDGDKDDDDDSRAVEHGESSERDDPSRLDVVRVKAERGRSKRRERGLGLGNFIIWALLLAGAVAAYVAISKAAQDATSSKSSSTTPPTPPPQPPPQTTADAKSDDVAVAPADAAIAVDPVAAIDAATDVAVVPLPATADAAPVVEPVAAIDAAATGTGEPDEIEMTPEEDPQEADPEAGDVVQEAPDEPDPGGTDDTPPTPPVDVAPPTTAPPIPPAKTVAEALALLKRGKAGRDAAIKGLNQQWRKNPRSARLPYILGNIYFDMRWWSIGMQHYRAAIKRGPGYRRNPTLIRNVIGALAAAKTRGKASWFLRNVIGKAARPYVRGAARYHKHPAVRRAASRLRI